MLAGLLTGARAGEITAGAVPGAINYQGRLERDNAPLTDRVHLTFRVYDALTGGSLIWASSEITVDAAQGIFNATIPLPWTALTGAAQLYLEVQVEGDIMSPREAISSVAFAMVAKKLEDGADLRVSTLTLINGDIIISTTDGTSHGIRFPNGTWEYSAGSLSAVDNLVASGDAIIRAGNAGPGSVLFYNQGVEHARVANNGNLGVGTLTPGAKLDVNGSVFVGGSGIYNRSGGNVSLVGWVSVSSGIILGASSESLSLGNTDNVISFTSGALERMRIHTNGYVGIGLANPSTSLQAAGVIYSAAAVRGSSISIGSFDASSWGNEIRTQTAVPLLLQQNSPYNVGIGTAAPLEKLHVNGSIRADLGVIAATAAFSGNVSVGGNFTANGNHMLVTLSSTVIHGSLQVTGGLLSQSGSTPSYISEDNVFSGHNTFQEWIRVSSDTISTGRIGAGLVGLDFPEPKYLQVGDYDVAGTDGLLYIAGGQSANAKLKFYIGGGTGQAASFETQGGVNLALVVAGQAKTYTDATYHRIQNSVLWVSTGYNSTPGIFVSSALANVGMGTSVLDPNARLTVLGNIRISTTAGGQDYGIIFPNGSIMRSSSSASVDTISNNGDAIVKADADTNGTGDVLLKVGDMTGLMLRASGNVGIGTLLPVSVLNVQGGDLVVGTPPQAAYASNGVEDLLVEGSVVVDGGIKQRSTIPVEFYSILSAGNVYLSTAAGSMTRIGSDTVPAYTLDVTGDIRASTNLNILGNIQTGGVTRITSGGDWNGNTVGVGYGGTGMTSGTQWGMPYFSAAAAMGSISAGTAGQALLAGGTSAPSWGTLSASYGGTGQTGGYAVGDILYASGAGTLSKLSDVITGNVLLSGGVTTAPFYGKVGLTSHVSGVLAIINGGTNSSTALTASAVMVSNGSAIIQGPQGTTATVLHGNAGGQPSYGQVQLAAASAEVSGILPMANGGTGLSGVTGILYGTGSNPLSQAVGTANTIAKWTTANYVGNSNLTDNGTQVVSAVGFTSLSSGTFRASGAAQYSLETASGIYITAGTFRMPNGAVDGYVLGTDATGKATWKSVGAGGVGDDWGDQVVILNANGTLSGSGINSDKLGINLGNTNTWTGVQTFSNGLSGALNGNATTATTATNLDGGGSYSFPYQSAADTTAMLAAGTAGYLLQTNNTGSAPTWVQATDTSVINTIVKRNGSGNFTAATITATSFAGALNGNANTATTATTATNIAGGGNYSFPYQSAAGTTAMLAAGTAGYLLQTNNTGSLPTWVQATDTSVINTIVKRNGSGNFTAATITATSFAGALNGNANTATTATTATNIAGGAAYSVPYQTSGGATAMLAAGTDGYVLTTHGAGTILSWAAINVDLTSEVSGQLPVGSGGTGVGGFNPDAVLVADATGNGMTVGVTGLSPASPVTFQVVGSTITSTCYNLTFDHGILTTKTTVACQ